MIACSTNARVRGFTLIEISIVLVIIALMAAGVLVGRSLLRQSQVNSLMVDAEKYSSAIQAFQAKYAALPGDMPNAKNYWDAYGDNSDNYTTSCYASGSATSVKTCNGNGDGQINYGGTYSNETLRVWQHLANASMIQGAYTGTTGIEHYPGTNSPASRVDGGGFGALTLGTLSGDSLAFDDRYGVVILLGGHSSGTIPVAGVLTATEQQSLDSKYDDGKPGLGSIKSWKTTVNACATTNVASTAVYNVSATGRICSFILKTGF